MTTTPDRESAEQRPRWFASSAARAVRRLLGTASLEEWQQGVETSLRDLRDRGLEVEDRRIRDDARLQQVERVVAVLTFDAWLELEQPSTDLTISVVLASRNRSDHLRAAIESVQAQRHDRWELLVVDDGSTDATPELLAAAEDRRIRVVHLDHVGVCAARNVALAAATGDVVTYLDDDNLMHPGWLQAVSWAFERSPDQDVLYGARIIDDELAVRTDERGGLPFLHFEAFDRARLEAENIADMNVIAHRRSHPNARFDESLSEFGDWELFARLTECADPLALPAIACAYRTSAPGRLSDGPGTDSAAEYTRVLRLIAERTAARPNAT